MPNLNERAWARCEQLLATATDGEIEVSHAACGARIIDCGVHARGGLEAGRALAEICLAGLASVHMTPGRRDVWAGPDVSVVTDEPVPACLASQYAGWKVTGHNYFAMGSGPMRAAFGDEAIFAHIGGREHATRVIGVLETSDLPPDDVCRDLAAKCRVAPEQLTLLAARTASIAGTCQIVARTVETALHKLHELGFDVNCVRSGHGVAPLAPVAGDDLEGIGRTNDAVLYGAEVTLWVDSDDETIATVGPRAPSCSSRDFGRPFIEVFRSYHCDFYQVDPLLFSPAVVTFCNLRSGRVRRFGTTRPDILARSFGMEP